jgi:hypothetical protein
MGADFTQFQAQRRKMFRKCFIERSVIVPEEYGRLKGQGSNFWQLFGFAF